MKQANLRAKFEPPIVFSALAVALFSSPVFALNPSLDISQYAHTAWTSRNGFLSGEAYAITQAADGYLWLGTQSGVVRFDGARTVPLSLPTGQQLPSSAAGAVLAARDGTLWIGTLDGLVSWKNGQLTQYPALARRTVVTLLQDRNGTVWAGSFGGPTGKLCAIRVTSTTCYGDDGKLGAAVVSLYQDSGGSLWVGAATGLWRWNPGPPVRYLATSIPGRQTLTRGDHASDLILAADSVRQIIGAKVLEYPLRGVPSPLTATSVLRDRDGGLWVGTTAHGLVHSYGGKTSLFTHDDGLSSDQVYALFEDREGTIWAATSDGLDEFRDFPVTTLTTQEGLSSATATSVLAARDGSVWIGTVDGLNRWDHGRATIYRERGNPGLPDDAIESLFEDERGRTWVSGFRGLAVFDNGRFTKAPSVPAGFKQAIAPDNHGGLWLSLWLTPNDSGLAHLVNGKIVEQAPWQKLGGGPGTGLAPDPDGGVWTGLLSGGIAYFRAGLIRTLPLTAQSKDAPKVFDLSRDRNGTFWAATENGLSRISNGRVATLTTANGLPCNAVHWIIEDDLSSYWLYTRCGLLRILQSELDAWAADPQRTIKVTTFDASDGIRLVPMLKGYRPAVAKSSDGKIWFVNGDAASFIDPSHIGMNTLPPPVHIEQIIADRIRYDAKAGLRLPALVRDISIDYTAISLVAPEKVHFKYKLEGQDRNWNEVVNERHAQYTNLPPRNYRFRVMARTTAACGTRPVTRWSSPSPRRTIRPTGSARPCGGFLRCRSGRLYRLRLHQLAREFNAQMEGRVDERLRVARDLHDTLLQSFQGLVPVFQTARNLLPGQSDRAAEVLDEGLHDAADAIVEGRNAIQNLRAKPSLDPDLGFSAQRRRAGTGAITGGGGECARIPRGRGGIAAAARSTPQGRDLSDRPRSVAQCLPARARRPDRGGNPVRPRHVPATDSR